VVALWALALAIGLPNSNTRYRAAGAVDRRRMQWIGWALAVGAEAILVVVALEILADWPPQPAIVALALTGLIPLALIAGTFPKLIGRIDRVLTATVSLAGLTALIVVVYVVVVVGLSRRPEDSERSLLLLSMLAAGIAALAYLPARRWLAERANRLVYGERVAPDETLRTFGQRLTRAIPLDELLLQLAESLRKSMVLASAEVWVGSDGHLELAAGVPHRDPPPLVIGSKELPVVARSGVSGGTWLDIWLPGLASGRSTATMRVAPIAHAGELLGLIVLARRPDGEPFTERDDTVLVELARQVGLALHNVQLDAALQASLEELQAKNTELTQSRARIVAAGDAERRKLERNLHDGAQQHLVALAVKIRLARDAVEDDPNDAVAMLGEVRRDVQEAIQELRALAHGIFPPLLVSGGLAEALPAAATRSPLPATVEIGAIGRYHQDIEAAFYFCCLEAMQNAAKHAGEGATLEVRVWEEAGELAFEVVDDGAGFDVARTGVDGHGFVNMGDRLGAIQGQLTVWAAPGQGTRVGGKVPL
jgi:signal transduction histidine kinase